MPSTGPRIFPTSPFFFGAAGASAASPSSSSGGALLSGLLAMRTRNAIGKFRETEFRPAWLRMRFGLGKICRPEPPSVPAMLAGLRRETRFIPRIIQWHGPCTEVCLEDQKGAPERGERDRGKHFPSWPLAADGHEPGHGSHREQSREPLHPGVQARIRAVRGIYRAGPCDGGGAGRFRKRVVCL